MVLIVLGASVYVLCCGVLHVHAMHHTRDLVKPCMYVQRIAPHSWHNRGMHVRDMCNAPHLLYEAMHEQMLPSTTLLEAMRGRAMHHTRGS